MQEYINVIKQAIIFFPFIALIITIPFILIEYHRFGSISKFKSIIIYSFILYFICAYFLVILPLPDKSVVSTLKTPRTQLIPFRFIIDFISDSTFNLNTIKQACFYVPIYNILLTIPFGFYLKYYFKLSYKRIIIYSLLLSLFYELTQLTGLYFIYNRGYRLFDVDDLILNTFGGLIGSILYLPFKNKLPKIEKLEILAKKEGSKISGLKRSTSFLLDIFLFIILDIIFTTFFNTKYTTYILLFTYYVIIPYINKGSTLGEKFVNIKVVDYNNKNNFFKLFFRKIMFVVIYFIIPIMFMILSAFIYKLNINQLLIKIMIISILSSLFLFYSIAFIKYLFTPNNMLYEKISRTKLVSTIKQKYRFKKIYLEVTNVCNLSCNFCIKNSRPSQSINFNDFRRVLNKINDYTDYLYFHILGEPLMHKDINKLIIYASKNFYINITTNGYLINKIKNNKNIRQVNISLHSYSNDYKISLNDYLDNIFDSIDVLVKNKTYISLRLWVRNKNNENIIKYINNRYGTNLNKDDKNYKINNYIFINNFHEFVWPDFNNKIYSEEGSCYALRDHIGILVDGTVIPCCLDTKGIINLGNIYKNSLEKIIDSNRVNNMIEGFKNNIKCEELCKHCKFIEGDNKKNS